MALLQETQAPPPTAAAAAAPVLGAGALAGFAGGAVLVASTTIAAAAASEPTAKAGLDTDVGTVPNAVTSFVFATGLEQWNGGYTWATYPGIALMLLAGTALGVAGVALIVTLAGRRPSPALSVPIGVAYGVVLQLLLLNGVIDGMQDVNGVHSAAPEWGWWLGHVLFGLTVGLAGGLLARRGSRLADEVTTGAS